MKKVITTQLGILILLSGSVFGQHTFNAYSKDSGTHISTKDRSRFLWSEFNVGYSNHGVMGSIAMNYRIGKLYFGGSYYKSHICYDVSKQQEYSPGIRYFQQHKTVQSISAISGIIFPGKLTPSLSVGISWLQFDYENTMPIARNVTLQRIWATIIGSDYKEEKLDAHSINTIGIPIGINLHFSPKHFVGVDAMFNANLNTHAVIISGGLGIHLGRIKSRSGVLNNNWAY